MSWLQSPSAVILEPLEIKSVTVSIVFPSICHKMMGLDAMIFLTLLFHQEALQFFFAFCHKGGDML